MATENIRRAAEMLLQGATLLAQPCPYCAGVRVIQNGRTLCASCGSTPEREFREEGLGTEQRVLELTRQLGTAKDPDLRKRIVEELTLLSGDLS